MPPKWGKLGVTVRKATEDEKPVAEAVARTNPVELARSGKKEDEVEVEQPQRRMFAAAAKTVKPVKPVAEPIAEPIAAAAAKPLAEPVAAPLKPVADEEEEEEDEEEEEEDEDEEENEDEDEHEDEDEEERKRRILISAKKLGKLIQIEEKKNPYLIDLDDKPFKSITDISFNQFVFVTYGDKLKANLEQDNPLLKSGDACKALKEMNPTDIKVYAYQAFIREYLRGSAPYRGLLVYHGLGSGKTCASIAALEALYSQSNKRIIVMTPLSLRENFLQEISFCGFRHFRQSNYWTALPSSDPINIIFGKSYLGLTDEYMKSVDNIWIPDFENESNFNELDPVYQDQIKAQIRNVLNNRFEFINYNGISQSALQDILINKKGQYDNAVIIIDEIHNLIRTIQGTLDPYLVQGVRGRMTYEPFKGNDNWKPQLPKYKRGYLFYRFLTGLKNTKIIGLSGTPVINYPEEIAILANILHGYIETIKFTVNIDSTQLKLLKKSLQNHKFVQSVLTKNDGASTIIEIEGIPDGFVKMFQEGRYIGLEQSDEGFKGIASLESELTAIFEKYKIAKGKPDFSSYPLLPPIGDEFRTNFFNNDTNTLKNAFVLMNRLSGLVSYYKGASKQLLPEVIEDNLVVLQMSDYQAKYYIKVRLEELKQEIDTKQEAPKATDINGFFAQLEAILGSSKKSSNVSYKMRSRQACNFAFPEGITRPRPVEIEDEVEEKLDKEIEGDADIELGEAVDDEVLKKIEDDELAADKVVSTTVATSRAAASTVASAVASKTKVKPVVDKKYEERIKETIDKLFEPENLAKLRLEGATNLRTYSPKYAAIIEKVLEFEESALVYSQFLMLEGLQCFTTALIANGFEPIEIGGTSFTKKTIQSLKKSANRFIIFSGAMSKEDRQLMINIFNCNYGKLPENIVRVLTKYGFENSVGNRNGQLCKIICITAAGAEGLSLKNCRQVHIMEPYWNDVRLQQVKGRAVRICSHDYDIRQVRIFTYCVKLPDEFKKKELMKDDDLTSDEVIYNIAVKKLALTKPLLNVLQNAAVDCNMNVIPNENDSYCFKFTALQDNLLYFPDYKEDIKILNDRFQDKVNSSPNELGVKMPEPIYSKGSLVRKDDDVEIYRATKLEKGSTTVGEIHINLKDGKQKFKAVKSPKAPQALKIK